jgi:hypothetical protein
MIAVEKRARYELSQERLNRLSAAITEVEGLPGAARMVPLLTALRRKRDDLLRLLVADSEAEA